MKTNRLEVMIDDPISSVFEFTLDPKYRKSWIPNLGEETVDSSVIGLGTKYQNDVGTYLVTDYEKNVFMELSSTKSSYICSYSFREHEKQTKITYFEYMEDGSELDSPILESSFTTLKELIETNN